MPGSLNLPDDSQVALSAQVKDDAGFVDPNAQLVWSSSDPTVVSLDNTTGGSVNASAVAAPGAVATVTLNVNDAAGNQVNGPDGTPLTDTLTVSIMASSDVSVGITPGPVAPKAPAPAPAPAPTPPGPPTP